MVAVSTVPGTLDRSPEHRDSPQHLHCAIAVSDVAVDRAWPNVLQVLVLSAYADDPRGDIALWDDPMHPARGWCRPVQP